MSNLIEGWQSEKHSSQRVYHYIRLQTSLCRKLGFYTGELMPWTGKPKSREDCAECYRRALASAPPAAGGGA